MLGKYGRSSLCGGCRIQGWLWQPTGTLGVGRGETFKDRKRYATPVYLPDASASSAGLLRCTALANSHSGSIYLHEIYINYQDYTGPVYIIQLCKHVGICIYGSVSRVAPPPWYGPPTPPPIPHTFCTRHCSETYISILLHARRCSETRIFILLDEPSRRIRWVDRAKLWRNASFKLQELLRAVHRTLQCSANGIIYIYISMYIHIHKHQ